MPIKSYIIFILGRNISFIHQFERLRTSASFSSRQEKSHVTPATGNGTFKFTNGKTAQNTAISPTWA